jgi:hypothetical protein
VSLHEEINLECYFCGASALGDTLHTIMDAARRYGGNVFQENGQWVYICANCPPQKTAERKI